MCSSFFWDGLLWHEIGKTLNAHALRSVAYSPVQSDPKVAIFMFVSNDSALVRKVTEISTS